MQDFDQQTTVGKEWQDKGVSQEYKEEILSNAEEEEKLVILDSV